MLAKLENQYRETGSKITTRRGYKYLNDTKEDTKTILIYSEE